MFPKIQPMITPKTRAEFEERFHHMHQSINAGKMHIDSHMFASICAVRRLPNGRLDFLSVDQTARLQANTTFQAPSFEEMAQVAGELDIIDKD